MHRCSRVFAVLGAATVVLVNPSSEATNWWAVLLDGSLGALLSTGAVFLALWLTLRHERRATRDLAMSESAAQVIKLLAQPPQPEDPDTEWWADVAGELAVMRARATRDHPDLARWATELHEWLRACIDEDTHEQSRLLKAQDEGRSFVVGMHLKNASQEAVRDLTQWQAGGFKDKAAIRKEAARLSVSVGNHDWDWEPFQPLGIY